MKKIIGLVLALVLLTSVFAVLPASAEGDATITEVAVHLDQGISLVYKLSDGSYERVPVAAKEMNKVAAPAGYTEGVTSVKAYAEDLRNKTDDEITLALVDAMLNYGAAAQNYFDYETGNLVGTPVTDTTALKGAAAPEVEINDEDGIYLGATLVLEGTLKLRFYFKGTGLEAFYNDNNQSAYGENVEKNFCYFDENVMPYDIFEPVTITVGTTTVSYAPINYLKAKANDTDEKLTAMVASIYDYAVAARAYYIEYNCEHKGITLNTVVVPTLFTEGLAKGICPLCGDELTEKVEKTAAGIIPVTNTTKDEHLVKEAERLGDVLADGQHFYPTTENPDGNSLYIEFSMLLNGTMDNFVGTNISFPGIYSDHYLRSDYGHSAFWFYIKNDSVDKIDKGHFDDWGSNKVAGTVYSNNTPTLAFDGWHRIAVEFHQNDNIDYSNKTVKSTMTVIMYVDGVKVYEATFGNGTKPAAQELLLYTAEFDGDEVVYTDCVNSYAAYMSYNAYVTDAANPAYIITADRYVTCGNDGFVVTVSPVENPAAQDFTQDGVSLSGKQYFAIKDLSDCYAGNHSWADSKTLDKAATCTTDGQRSVKCTVCGEIDEASIETIPAAHTWGGYTVDTIATAFSEGLSRWTCSVCRDVKTEPIAKTTPRVGVHNQVSNKRIDSYNYDQLKDIMGDSHFYPTESDPDGNDLLVELSILFNESMNNYINDTTNLTLGGIFSDSKLTDGKNTHWFHFKGTKAGSFDFQDEDYEIVHGPELSGDFLSNRLDGWHRFGIRYHQNTVRDGDTFTYSMTVTLYIDGVRVHEYILNNDKGTYTALLLYKAEVVDGEIKYTEYTDKYAGIFRFNSVVKNVDDPAYFIYADHKVSCADDFYLNVSPVTNPEAQDYVVNDDVTFSGKEYFTVNGLKDCDLGNHSWAGKATTDKAATCTEDGSKSIKCTVCGAVKPDSTTTIPAAHAWGGYTTDVEATCTENGQKSIKCLTCKETKPGSVEIIESAGQHVLGADAVITTTATVFTEGVKTGTCTICKNQADEVLEKTTANFTKVTVTGAGKQYLKESERLGDVLEDGQHFHPTEDNPDGNSLYVEFSILLNSSMDNFKGSNITFPGIFGDSSLSSSNGYPAFWFFLRDGDAVKGKCDDWTSNAVDKYDPDLYYNNQTALAFDGWHRIGIEFHQNTDIDYDNKTISYTMTVTMLYDGVEVYKATLGSKIDKTKEVLLYTAEFDGDEVVYTDRVNSYATYYTYDAYVSKSSNPAYFVTADMYMTCGNDGFVLDVSPVTNPEAEDFTQDGVTLSGKQYFTVNN